MGQDHHLRPQFQSRGRDLLIGKLNQVDFNSLKGLVSVPWSGFINRKDFTSMSLIAIIYVSVPWSGFINRKEGWCYEALETSSFQSRGRDLLIGKFVSPLPALAARKCFSPVVGIY